MIPTVEVQRRSTIGNWFNLAWTEVFETTGQAIRRCTELNQSFLHRQKLDHRAQVKFRDEDEIMGTCEICQEDVFDGDQFCDEECQIIAHDWCIKSLDRPEDVNPSWADARGLF